MSERFQINKETGIFDKNSVKIGSGKSGQIKSARDTWFGKKVRIKDVLGQSRKVNVQSLINFLKETDEGKKLKKGIFGLGGSSRGKVIKAFTQYKNRMKEKMENEIKTSISPNALEDGLLEPLSDKVSQISEEVNKIEETEAFVKVQEVKIPEKDRAFFAQLEKEYPEYKTFANEVLNSPKYTEEEKRTFFGYAKSVYELDGKLIGPTDWLDQSITIDALNALEQYTNPFYNVIDVGVVQFVAEDFKPESVTKVLPNEIPFDGGIYGTAMQVNGNHRTAFIIDFNKKTVEYFNSFGDDSKTEAPLRALAKELETKYNVPFNYEHRTDGAHFQKDGYQCGVWAYILIKDRAASSVKFSTERYEDFPIAQARKEMLLQVLKYRFYTEIGRQRLTAYVKTNYPDATKSKMLMAFPLFRRYFSPKWCQTGEMPLAIKQSVDKVLGLAH